MLHPVDQSGHIDACSAGRAPCFVRLFRPTFPLFPARAALAGLLAN